MSNVTISVTQCHPASAELLLAELKKQDLTLFPIEVLEAYIDRYDQWGKEIKLIPSKVAQEIVASPFSYCKVNEMYLFEGNYFATVGAITDHVIDNSYGLITDEVNQIVYYIVD